jgi:hypothetical protein
MYLRDVGYSIGAESDRNIGKENGHMAAWSGKTITSVSRHDELEPEFFKQRRRPESGKFRLQVDRQTKAWYATREAADEAALAINKAFPILQVAVHDTATGDGKIIELPNG